MTSSQLQILNVFHTIKITHGGAVLEVPLQYHLVCTGNEYAN